MAMLFLAFGIGRITSGIYRPVLLAIGLLWVFLTIKSFFKKNTFLMDRSVVYYLLFVVIYSVLILTSKDISTTIGYLGSYLIYLILFVMAAYYIQIEKKDRMVLICKYLLVWIGILCVFAILYYRNNPGAARLYATHRSDLNGYMIGGGYQLAYLSAMILPVIIDEFLKKKGNYKLLLLAIVMIIDIYMTTSVITMLTTLIGCFVSFAFSGKKKRKMLSLGVGLAVIVIFLLTKNILGSFLIKFADGRNVTSFATMNNATYVRLTEIGMVLKGGSVTSGYATSLRLENYMRPLNDIVNHPIFGAIFSTGVNPEASNFNDSTIMIALVTWGIPLAFLNLFPLFYKMREYKNYIGSMVVLVLTLLLNPSEGFSLYAAAIIILPTLAYMNRASESVSKYTAN
jgi:hypothetical protein